MSKKNKSSKTPINDFAKKVLNQWIVRDDSVLKGEDAYRREAYKFDELFHSENLDIKNSFFNVIKTMADNKGLDGKDVAQQIRKDFTVLSQETSYGSEDSEKTYRMVLVGVPLFNNLDLLQDNNDIVYLFRKSGMAPATNTNVQLLGLLNPKSTLELALDFEAINNLRAESYGSTTPSPYKESLTKYFHPSLAPSTLVPSVAVFAIESYFPKNNSSIEIPAFDLDVISDEESPVSKRWDKELKKYLKDKDKKVKDLFENAFPCPLFEAATITYHPLLKSIAYNEFFEKVGDKNIDKLEVVGEFLFLDDETDEISYTTFFNDEKKTVMNFSLKNLTPSFVMEMSEWSEVPIYKMEEKSKILLEYAKELKGGASLPKTNRVLH